MIARSSLHQASHITGRPPHRVAALKRAAQQLFAAFGIELLQTRTLNSYIGRYAEACVELEACFRQVVFDDLPPCSRRAALLAELQGTGLSEAMYVLRFLHLSLPLDGDVCEFGIAQGATSALLANEIRDSAKNLWLFDSFEGLPVPGPQDVLIDDIYKLGSMHKYAGKMAEAPGLVLERLRRIDFPRSRINIVAGFIEHTIRTQPMPAQVCFAYVDFDLYEPIKTALRFLDGCLAQGGYVVVDDYGHFSAGAQTAVDEFVAAAAGRYALILPPDFAGHFAVLQKLRHD